MARSSAELCLRIERCEAALTLARARAVAAPGVHARDFGGPVALATLDRPNTLFNRALGLGPDDADRVSEIVAFYTALGVPARIDVCPALRGPHLTAKLEACGLQAGGFPFFSRRVMVGATRATDAPADGISIERAEPADAESFVAILESAWPVGEAAHARAIAEARAPLARGQHRYFASIDGTKVAVAGMDVRDGIAYLNLAATLETHRGRGCQSALVRHRLADAAAAGVDVAFSLVAPGSGSERNLRRAGLELGYDRELFLPPDWTRHPFYEDAA